MTSKYQSTVIQQHIFQA